MKLPEIVHVVSYNKRQYDQIREIAERWYYFKSAREKKIYDQNIDETYLSMLQREWIIDFLLEKLGQRDEWKPPSKKQMKNGIALTKNFYR